MVRRVLSLGVAIVVAAVFMSGCGDDDTETTVPTAEQLSSALITVDDLDGDWTVNEPPDASAAALSGVIPDDEQDMLPKLEMCDKASAKSRAAADSLRWRAYRQLDLTADDPIEPPDRTGHVVFVQEFLTSGEPDQIETTFNLLRNGMQACLGDLPAEGEGPGTSETMTIPAVGDERFGVLITVEEAGAWAEWRIHSAFMRQGPVLMVLTVVDIRAGEGVEPFYSIEEIGEFLRTAVDKL